MSEGTDGYNQRESQLPKSRLIEELAREYQLKLEENGISVPKEKRNCCMLSNNQPNKIVQEDLSTKKNYEFSMERNFRKEKIFKHMIQQTKLYILSKTRKNYQGENT